MSTKSAQKIALLQLQSLYSTISLVPMQALISQEKKKSKAGADKSGDGKESLVHTDYWKTVMCGWIFLAFQETTILSQASALFLRHHMPGHALQSSSEATGTNNDDTKMLGHVLWNPLDMQDYMYTLSPSK